MSLRPDSTLGSYTILELLGRGGMGEVYLARDTKLERDVAIKLLPDSMARDKERVLRFEREAKASASGMAISKIFASGMPPGEGRRSGTAWMNWAHTDHRKISWNESGREDLNLRPLDPQDWAVIATTPSPIKRLANATGAVSSK